MNKNYSISNDILVISYYINKNHWKNVSKTNYQRILYFSEALSPIFAPNYNWSYYFSNTIFGPYNSEIAESLQELSVKQFIKITERKVSANRVFENYCITEKGKLICESVLFKIESETDKYKCFKMVVKVLSIYGSDFLVKLIKSDPNINSLNKINKMSRIVTDNSEENLSKEFFMFLKKRNTSITDEDTLLLFFDILYRKYKGGESNG
ncbi:hypothetical protein LI058_15125 [Clostridium perfringens]|uniref:hypothetical protein n=1 Tax=Clostridium perfringens TaxID=1502 RepID=UPI000776A073|nr:hypothetical protein [Clostridium perfringens]AMN32110.1 hypothetical protein JFP55_04015 [Clostridium perfringens]ASY50833.1 hypothetical protein BG908_03905 [Clostridium perfringens]AWS25326.1 hypothetical protein CYK96_06860 [Clostridium perfringens]MCX0374800.1 hypothetical protein [Clostridium perfringens]VTQ55773.1 Uncharacterised protein [Clostridium perfringens]